MKAQNNLLNFWGKKDRKETSDNATDHPVMEYETEKDEKMTATPEDKNQTRIEYPLPGYNADNTTCLTASLNFLWQTSLARMNHFFGRTAIFQVPEFTLPDDGSPFAKFVIERNLSMEEFLALLTALAPHVHPNFFGQLVGFFLPKGGDFPEFGGIKSANARSFLPTGETLLFILAELNLTQRIASYRLWSDDHFFAKEKILYLEGVKDGEPETSGSLILAKDYVELFLTGQVWKPRFGNAFPAKRVSTPMEWEDLIVPDNTLNDLQLIKKWLKYDAPLRQDPTMQKKVKPGFRSLFYGPPGTGKTLTATLLGKEFQKDVYRIDLSMVISKYIGETEKNLATVFEIAANKDWILFFDEADALFGKRSTTTNAHDRYANQEVSYLLQRIEEHSGLVVLATNFKNNIDSAFMRRFHTSILFPMPSSKERKRLWESTLPNHPAPSPGINLQELADKFELSGAGILNVVHLAAIRALADDREILKSDLIEEIRKEYDKEGRTF